MSRSTTRTQVKPSTGEPVETQSIETRTMSGLKTVICTGDTVPIEEYITPRGADLPEKRTIGKIVGFVDFDGNYIRCAPIMRVVNQRIEELRNAERIILRWDAGDDDWVDPEVNRWGEQEGIIIKEDENAWVYLRSDQLELLYKIPGRVYTSNTLVSVPRLKVTWSIYDTRENLVLEKGRIIKKMLAEKYGVPPDRIELIIRIIAGRDRIAKELTL